MNIKRAFTLIELLVVITIILILLGLIAPMLGTVKEKVNRGKCQTHLKQIHLASIQRFAEDKTRFPNIPADPDRADALMPYLKYIGDVFSCPSAPGTTVSFASTGTSNVLDYAFNNNIWLGSSQAIISDATLALLAYDRALQYTHDSGLNFVFMDGHAVFVTTNKMPVNPNSDGIEK